VDERRRRAAALRRLDVRLADREHALPADLQQVLDRKAKSLASVDVHQVWTVEAVEDTGDGVLLTARAGREGAGGEPTALRARYVIGADGANSFVRDRMAVGMTDLGFSYDCLIADVIENEPRVWDPPLQQFCDPVRPTTKVSGGPGRRRWEWKLLPGERREDVDDEAMAWKLLTHDHLGPENATLERAKTWTFRARWADTWRKGRLVLAGDAPHLMPPFAGQGMCSGLRDVANLAWRLELILDGRAPDALLSSYTPERSQHLQHAIMFSVELGQVMCTTDPDAAAARDAQMIAAPDNPAPPAAAARGSRHLPSRGSSGGVSCSSRGGSSTTGARACSTTSSGAAGCS
jgi:2-polyprenyl-6-methoxyphenol hydroxylase-like FAD-dependent oxidoreductase